MARNFGLPSPEETAARDRITAAAYRPVDERDDLAPATGIAVAVALSGLALAIGVVAASFIGWPP